MVCFRVGSGAAKSAVLRPDTTANVMPVEASCTLGDFRLEYKDCAVYGCS